MTKKIVITGIGATSPLGGTARDSWNALLAGESGARHLEQEWVTELELPVTFAATAKVATSEVLERHEQKRLDPSSQFALIAGREAWADAGAPEVAPERLAVDWSTGIGGVWTLLDAWDTLRERGPRRVLPMTVLSPIAEDIHQSKADLTWCLQRPRMVPLAPKTTSAFHHAVVSASQSNRKASHPASE